MSAAPDLARFSDPQSLCGPPVQGRAIVDPPELFSNNGVLNVTLTLIGQRDPVFDQVLCWAYTFPGKNGPKLLTTPPTLHLKQGDRLEITLINDLLAPTPSQNNGAELSIDRRIGETGMGAMAMAQDDSFPCGQQVVDPVHTPDPATGRIYSNFRPPYNETNLHFHGLNTSPKQPGDNTTMVLLCPRQNAAQAPESYNYIVDIPRNEPPGLYWYHPHAHGESEHQLLEQLTGAIVVDTIAPSVPDNYTNRVIIVRDLGDGTTSKPRESALRKLRSRFPTLAAIRSDIAQNGLPQPDWYRGTDGYPYGPPDQCPSDLVDAPRFNSKQLLVNGVLLPPRPNQFGRLPYTSIASGETQYWRLANTSADTILNLELLVNNVRVPIQVTSRDGVPLITQNGHPTWQPVPTNHVYLDPAARVEFFLTGTNPGDQIVLRTLTIDTGCGGDSDFERDLLVAHVVTGPKTRQLLAAPHAIDPVPLRFSDLGSKAPVRKRIFVLTEYQRDDSPEPDFYITELTNPKAVEHPYAMVGPPDVVVKDGTVEDWTILNYTEEVHAFHIHQIHFMVLKGGGPQGGVGQLLDTVNVPYGVFQPGGKTGDQMNPGAVTLRMDFRDKNIVGEFVYHCHILEHEDNGMMAKIRVTP